MIRSMTGYGNATIEFDNKKITVEIRSVNSKFLDLNMRLPMVYKEKEMELRLEAGRDIERGKSEVIISIEQPENTQRAFINRDIFRSYYNELKSIAGEFNLKDDNMLPMIMAMPDVVSGDKASLSQDEWTEVKKAFATALQNFNNFRINEGKALESDMRSHIEAIVNDISVLEVEEPSRLEVIRKRLELNLEEFIQANNIDRNRLEQELIFYIEKLDISEEKVRLKSHCEYFINTLAESTSPGKKLAFISQEIGREINTIGSKANNAVMQKTVVMMKDRLEKIKEQVLNIL